MMNLSLFVCVILAHLSSYGCSCNEDYESRVLSWMYSSPLAQGRVQRSKPIPRPIFDSDISNNLDPSSWNSQYNPSRDSYNNPGVDSWLPPGFSSEHSSEFSQTLPPGFHLEYLGAPSSRFSSNSLPAYYSDEENEYDPRYKRFYKGILTAYDTGRNRRLGQPLTPTGRVTPPPPTATRNPREEDYDWGRSSSGLWSSDGW